eukprot:Opistho-1_new@67733
MADPPSDEGSTQLPGMADAGPSEVAPPTPAVRSAHASAATSPSVLRRDPNAAESPEGPRRESHLSPLQARRAEGSDDSSSGSRSPAAPRMSASLASASQEGVGTIVRRPTTKSLPTSHRRKSVSTALSSAYNRFLEKFVDNDVEGPVDKAHAPTESGPSTETPRIDRRGSIRKSSERSVAGGIAAPVPAAVRQSSTISPFAIAKGLEDEAIDEEAYGVLPAVPERAASLAQNVEVGGEMPEGAVDAVEVGEDGAEFLHMTDTFTRSHGELTTTGEYDSVFVEETGRTRARVLAILKLKVMCVVIGVCVASLSVAYMALCVFLLESFHPTSFNHVASDRQWLYLITQFCVCIFWIPMPYVIIRFVFSEDLVPRYVLYVNIVGSVAIIVYLLATQGAGVYNASRWYWNAPPYLAALVVLMLDTRAVSSDKVIAVIQMIRRNVFKGPRDEPRRKTSSVRIAFDSISNVFKSRSGATRTSTANLSSVGPGQRPAWAEQLSRALGGANIMQQSIMQGSVGIGRDSTVSTMQQVAGSGAAQNVVQNLFGKSKTGKRRSPIRRLRRWWASPNRLLAMAVIIPIGIGIVYMFSFQVAVAEWYSQDDTSETQRRLYIILVIPAASFAIQQMSMNACKKLPKILLPNAWALATFCLLTVALSKRLLLAALDDIKSIALFTALVELGQMVANLTVDLRAALVYKLVHARPIPLSILRSRTRFVFHIQFFVQRLIVDYASTLVAGITIIMVNLSYFSGGRDFVWRVVVSMVVQVALQIVFALPYLWVLVKKDFRKFNVMYDQRRQLLLVCTFLMFVVVVAASTQMIRAMQKNISRVTGTQLPS